MIVVLDSTEFIRSGLEQAPLADLLICAKRGDAVVVVPEMVIREVSHHVADRAAREKRVELKRLQRWLGEASLDEALAVIDEQFRDRVDLVEGIAARLSSWVKEADGTVSPLTEVQGVDVFDDYFSGAGVFVDAARDRKHLPDAWILQCARNQMGGDDEVALVTADKRLAGAANREGVRVFATVADLLLHSGVQNWMRVSDIRIENEVIEDLMVSVAESIALPGDPVWIPDPVAGTKVSLDREGRLATRRGEALTEEGVAYLSFQFEYADACSVLEDDEFGRPFKTLPIGPITASGHLRLEVHRDPAGELHSGRGSIAEVATHAPPGHDGC